MQARADTRRIPINRVGIKDIRHPVRVKDRSAGEQHTIATFNMYVNLPHNFKGTHMSRFVEILHHEREISVDSFRSMLGEMTERLDADAGHIEMTFPFFVMKRAPVTGVESLMDYQASLIGEIRRGEARTWIKVVVPVTSLCPCSKKISDRGAHNQRSHVTIKARLREHMWIEELIDIAESEASCELYGILKRPDEKYVTERAYDNPKFVEDMVRDVAVRLNSEERISRLRGREREFRVDSQSLRLRADRARQGSDAGAVPRQRLMAIDDRPWSAQHGPGAQRQSWPERQDLLGPAAAGVAGERMTLQGTINKSFLLLVVLMGAALWPWSQYLASGNPAVVGLPMMVGVLGGLVLALIISFKATLGALSGGAVRGLRGPGDRRHLGDAREALSRHRHSGGRADLRRAGGNAARLHHRADPRHAALSRDRRRRHRCGVCCCTWCPGAAAYSTSACRF